MKFSRCGTSKENDIERRDQQASIFCLAIVWKVEEQTILCEKLLGEEQEKFEDVHREGIDRTNTGKETDKGEQKAGSLESWRSLCVW